MIGLSEFQRKKLRGEIHGLNKGGGGFLGGFLGGVGDTLGSVVKVVDPAGYWADVKANEGIGKTVGYENAYTIANLIVDYFAPPVGAWMHAAHAGYSAAKGNYLSAVGNAYGAYSGGIGSGLSSGGVGSAGTIAVDEAGNLVGTASGGYSDWTAAMERAVDSGGWQQALAQGFDPSYMGYNLGGTMYTPDDLPMNLNGIDIARDSGQGTFAGDIARGGNVDLTSQASAMSVPGTGLNNVGVMPLSDTTNSALDVSGLDQSAIASPSFDSAGQGLQSFDNVTYPSAGTGGLGVDSSGNLFGTANAPEVASTPWNVGTNSSGLTGSAMAPNETFLDKLYNTAGQVANKAGEKFMQKPLMNTIKGAGALSGIYSNYQNSQMLGDYLNKIKSHYNALSGQYDALSGQYNALSGQRDYYANLLQQSYDNPMALQNNADYKALSDIFQKQIERRDAAAGRRSQYGARAGEMSAQFANYLNNYRNQLGNYAFNYGQAANQMYNQMLQAQMAQGQAQMAQGQAQRAQGQARKNMWDAGLGGLTSIFG